MHVLGINSKHGLVDVTKIRLKAGQDITLSQTHTHEYNIIHKRKITVSYIRGLRS
jgi:hypothetical protein